MDSRRKTMTTWLPNHTYTHSFNPSFHISNQSSFSEFQTLEVLLKIFLCNEICERRLLIEGRMVGNMFDGWLYLVCTQSQIQYELVSNTTV